MFRFSEAIDIQVISLSHTHKGPRGVSGTKGDDMTAKKKRGARLTPSFVKTVTTPGTYGDGRGGHGLSLVVTPRTRGDVGKTWKQRVRIKDAKPVNLGLGAYPTVSLHAAREKAEANAKIGADGNNPRDAAKGIPTFGEAAKKVFDRDSIEWSENHQRTVRSILKNHALPELEHKPVNEISSDDIGEVLDPIWADKAPTARILLGFLRRIFAWCKRQRHITESPIPPDFTDGMANVQHKVQHHPALPYHRVVEAIEAVRQSGADIATKLCLINGSLTGCRPGESRKAEWCEVRWKEIRSIEDWGDDGWEEVDWDNLEANGHKTIVWFVPAGHTKKRRPHRVPVSSLHLQLLKEAREISGPQRDPSLIFPSPNGGVLNRNTMYLAFNKLGFEAVSYGFRSTFRNWCSRAGVPFEVAELAIAHRLPPVVAAYVRDDLLENRVRLMQAWSDLLEGKQPTDWKWDQEADESVRKDLEELKGLIISFAQRAEKAEARQAELEAALADALAELRQLKAA